MKKPTKKQLIKYGVASGAGLAYAIYAVISQDAFSQELSSMLRIFSDAFFLPGALMILIGLLMVVSNEGAFDALAYTGKSLRRLFIPERPGEKRVSYREYVEQRQEKKATGFAYLFVVGGVFAVIGLIFVLVFYFV